MEIYLDQAAAARPEPAVLDFYRRELALSYANQEAAHRLGYDLRGRLEEVARELSRSLTGRDDYLVVWGNNGTELFNLLADSPLIAGKRVLSSRLEHPALLASLHRTATKVDLVPVGADGRLRVPEEVNASVAFFHQVQSELGVVQDIKPLVGVALIVDAIQSAGKLPLPSGFDVAVISGHKFGAPGGAALLIRPEFSGASSLVKFARRYRHTDYRCGRPEPALLFTMAFASSLRCTNLERDLERIRELNLRGRQLLSGLSLPGGKRSYCTIAPELASPYILHLMLPEVQAGVIVRMLSERGIMVAAGSACASESRDPSPALVALGFSRGEAYSGLRIGFGFNTSFDEVKKLAGALEDVLKNY